MSNMMCICGGMPARQHFSEHFEALRCPDCKSARFVPRSGAELREFVYDGQDEKYSDEHYLRGKELRWAHKQLLRRRWNGKKVLEIGCFNGFFVDELRKAGADSYGFDLNERALSAGKTVFCLDDRLFSKMTALRDHGPFDVVVCIDLLEHLDAPEILLQDIAVMLKPGGTLIVAGPTVERRFHDKSDYPPHHKWWFSRRGLERLLSRVGYRTSEVLIQRDGMLLLRNFAGKALSGLDKREFYGNGVGAAGAIELTPLAIFYSVLSWLGKALFSILRISYCSTLMVAVKAESQKHGVA